MYLILVTSKLFESSSFGYALNSKIGYINSLFKDVKSTMKKKSIYEIKFESKLKHDPPRYRDLKSEILQLYLENFRFSKFTREDFQDFDGKFRNNLLYYYQLKTKEWFDKRVEVFVRDNFTCTCCSKSNEHYLLDIKGEWVSNHHKVRAITDQEYEKKVDAFIQRLESRPSTKLFRKEFSEKKYNSWFLEQIRWKRSQRKVSSLPENYEWNTLEVHHKYYIDEALAWEYDLSALETLCDMCHRDYHLNNNVKLYSKNFNPLISIEKQKHLVVNESSKCSRCYGEGYIEKYKHVEYGVCFKCNGSGLNF